MPRKAKLFDAAKGSPVKGYMLLKRAGGNVPPGWLDRAYESRKGREEELAEAIEKGKLKGARRDQPPIVKEWETAFQKECFYYGIRALMEIERNGKTKL